MTSYLLTCEEGIESTSSHPGSRDISIEPDGEVIKMAGLLHKMRSFMVSLAQRWRNPKKHSRSEQLQQSEDNRPSLSIQIGEFDGLGLIIEYPSRVHYTNQTGGYACRHPVQEGAFIILDNTYHLGTRLEAHFTGEKWGGHCYDGIDVETADFVDDFLHETCSKLLKVDRSRLKECQEAWVYVIVEQDKTELPEWNIDGRGVLTWNNSD